MRSLTLIEEQFFKKNTFKEGKGSAATSGKREQQCRNEILVAEVAAKGKQWWQSGITEVMAVKSFSTFRCSFYGTKSTRKKI